MKKRPFEEEVGFALKKIKNADPRKREGMLNTLRKKVMTSNDPNASYISSVLDQILFYDLSYEEGITLMERLQKSVHHE